MRRLGLVFQFLVVTALLLVPASAAAQYGRFDFPEWTINQSAPIPGGMYPMLAFPGVTVQLCATWNNTACTSLLQTYLTSTGTACPTNAQLVSPQPGSTCSATTDLTGDLGGFALPGAYAYFVTTSQGTFGPYQFAVDAGGAYCPISGCTFTAPISAPDIWVDPTALYNASGQGNVTTTGTISSGSLNQVTVASANTWAIGQGISVVGVTFSSSPATTVNSISGNTLTLAASASGPVSGALVIHNDTAALNAAISAGSPVQLRCGQYNITAAVTIGIPNPLEGYNSNCTSLVNYGLYFGASNNVLNITYVPATTLVPEIRVGGISIQQATSPLTTTGSISASSATLTIASANGWVNGMGIGVVGAGAGGNTLFTTISSGGGTTTLTLAANASVMVSGALTFETPIAGAGIRVGGATCCTQGLHLHDIDMPTSLWQCIDIEGNQLHNVSFNTTCTNPVARGWYYNSGPPNGDDYWYSHQNQGPNSNLVINASDVTHFVGLKQNGSEIQFTDNNPIEKMVFDDVSVESAPSCGVDFGPTPAQVVGINFNGGEIDQTTTAFCNTPIPTYGTSPAWTASNIWLNTVTNIITGVGLSYSSMNVTMGQTFYFQSQANFLVNETTPAAGILPTNGLGLQEGIEINSIKPTLSFFGNAGGAKAILHASILNGVTREGLNFNFNPADSGCPSTAQSINADPDDVTDIFKICDDTNRNSFFQGPLNVPYLAGAGSASTTFTAGAALSSGGSFSAPACTGSHVCDSISGQFVMTSGSAATTGTIVTIALGGANRTNIPNCIATLYASSTGTQIGVYAFNNTTANLVLQTAGAALSSNTTYVGSYVCGGK